MSEFLPVKPIYTGTDVTALGEAQPDDVMLAPGGGIKFPDGSIQTEAGGGGSSNLKIYEFVATAGQTSFSGADANGATLAYKATAVWVTLNGAELRPGEDYTATDGSTIVLVLPIAYDDDTLMVNTLTGGSGSGGGGDVDLTNYYTKAEVDAAVAAAVAKYLPLTGGTLSGALHVAAEISSTADIVAFKS